MTRGIFNWNATEVIKFLKHNGFQFAHARGSHQYYFGFVRGVCRQVCVPLHGKDVIKPRTMKSIMLQSGIEKDDWKNF